MKKLIIVFLLITTFSYSQQTVSALIARYEVDLAGQIANGNVPRNPEWGFQSGGATQQHYYSAYWLDAEIKLWQITGNNAYFDKAKEWIDDMLDDTVNLTQGNTGYVGWTATSSFLNARTKAEGVPLWENFAWRFVTDLLTIMHDNPDYITSRGLTTWYTNTLNFIRINIFNKWYQNTNWGSPNGAIYRSVTHINSAAMTIAAALDYIYDEEHPDYNPLWRTVWQNIAYNGMPGWIGDNNLRDKLVLEGGAYVWYMDFVKSGTPSLVQDVAHGAEFVNNLHSMYMRGQYWTETDMIRFANGFENLIIASPVDYDQYANVDGSGGELADNQLESEEYWVIARFCTEAFQDDLEDGIMDNSNHNKKPTAALLAYNRFLEDGGTLVYGNDPEAVGPEPEPEPEPNPFPIAKRKGKKIMVIN